MSLVNRRSITAAAGAGALGAARLLTEPYLYRLMTRLVPLAPGRPSLEILHISDLHMKESDKRLTAFVKRIPDRLERTPDFVLATGDLIEDDAGIEPAVSALSALEARWGRFYVLGSHDYYQARFKPLTRYFGGRGSPVKAPLAATSELERGLRAAGWRAVTNATEFVETDWGRVRVSGVDDPYLDRHTTGHIARRKDDVLALALVHAPDVVSEWALNHFDLIVAGHTHAGQVRVPLAGAVVTNCSLPAALAGGLHRVGDTWLHVSPGLGQGKYTPIRFGARPEITLLRLEATIT